MNVEADLERLCNLQPVQFLVLLRARSASPWNGLGKRVTRLKDQEINRLESTSASEVPEITPVEASPNISLSLFDSVDLNSFFPTASA